MSIYTVWHKTHLIDVSHCSQRHAERAKQQIGDAQRQHECRGRMSAQVGVHRQGDDCDEVSCLRKIYISFVKYTSM